MPHHYDRLENRTPAARETALFRDLRHILAVSKPRAPALRHQLKGIDVNRLMTRAELARIDVIRQADIVRLQGETMPFGGLVASRLGALARVYVSDGDLVAVEGQAKDWWGVGRGLYAAGLRKGSLVLNCFSYDLVADGPMFESGARALCCPVVAVGNADVDRITEVMPRLAPTFYCGTAARLKQILDRSDERGLGKSSITAALVTGPLSCGLRNELALRGVAVRHAYVDPELGLVAYESEASDGMILNEGLLLEIVVPGTGVPLAPGASGEIVVSRINADYFGTGMVSAVLPHASVCGRTNMCLRPPERPRSERGPISQAHINEIARQFPMLGRMHIIVRRRGDRDELHLRIEHAGNGAVDSLGDGVSALVHTLTHWRGTVEFVRPGSLGDEDSLAADERSLN
jgi:phenylacetate-CoA ligase